MNIQDGDDDPFEFVFPVDKNDQLLVIGDFLNGPPFFPRFVFFDIDGNPFTPWNFTSTGGVIRQKPDVSAADGVSTHTPGFDPFFGSSAGAAVTTGIAALLRELEPALTPDEIERLLKKTALDIEAAGVDENAGFGVVDGFGALDDIDLVNGEDLINDSLNFDDLDGAFDPDDRRAPKGVLPST